MASGWRWRHGIDAALGATVNLFGLAGNSPVPVCAHLRSGDPSSRVRLSLLAARPNPQLERTIVLLDTREIPVPRHVVVQSVATDSHSSIMWLVPVEGIADRAVPSGELEGKTARG
jgi:hypothetical protein